MELNYGTFTTELGETLVTLDNGDGTMTFIPMNLENPMYQAYLNRDKPKVEHLTEIVPSGD